MQNVSRNTVSVNEYAQPTAYALGNSLPDELSAPGFDMTYSDAEMNAALDEIADDQLISSADMVVREELSEAKSWLKSLTDCQVTVSRTIADSDCYGQDRKPYMVAIYTPLKALWGSGHDAMEAAKDAAQQLNVNAVA